MKRGKGTLAEQVKRHASGKMKERPQFDGSNTVISTGSTLLDLAISGGRFKTGGIPMGILVEIFGPSSSGKTVLLCEVAGQVRKKDGNVMFNDPESRINKQFARLFGLDFESEKVEYLIPDTVTELFQAVRKWKKEGINGVFADSLAALSTDLEMSSEDGDKMGQRRAKEFSQELRRTCRIITEKNQLVVCSNQIRQNSNAGQYGQKYISPGGEAIGFYSSLRLRFSKADKLKKEKKIHGKEVKRTVGVETLIEVFKSTVWKPYYTAPVTISFDYGIDDIRENLKFIKAHTSNKIYTVGGSDLSNSIDDAVKKVEDHNKEKLLKREVIQLWNRIEGLFKIERKPKYME